MRPGRRRAWSYGVERCEIQAFVDGSVLVQDYLGKFAVDGEGLDEDGLATALRCNGKVMPSRTTGYDYGRYLCMFFKWLRSVENVDLSPEQLLSAHLMRKSSLEILERKWTSRYVLRFTRDNPDFAGSSDGYKIRMFNAIKQFFDCNEAPLLCEKRVWGKHKKRKFHPKRIDATFARKVLGVQT